MVTKGLFLTQLLSLKLVTFLRYSWILQLNFLTTNNYSTQSIYQPTAYLFVIDEITAVFHCYFLSKPSYKQWIYFSKLWALQLTMGIYELPFLDNYVSCWRQLLEAFKNILLKRNQYIYITYIYNIYIYIYIYIYISFKNILIEVKTTVM